MCLLDINTFVLLFVVQNSTIEPNIEWVGGSKKVQKCADIIINGPLNIFNLIKTSFGF